MANAKKCDKCGEYYAERMNPIIGSIRRITVIRDLHPFGEINIDLCEKCYQELLDFLNLTIEQGYFGKG